MLLLAAGKGSSHHETLAHVSVAGQYFLKADASFMPQRVGINLGITEANNIVKPGERSLLPSHNLILSTSCSLTPTCNLRATNTHTGQNVLGPELVKTLWLQETENPRRTS